MKVQQLLEVVNLIKKESEGYTDMYMGMFNVLLLVAEHPGVTSTELAQMIGTTNATITRAVQGLSAIGIRPKKAERDQGKPAKPGLDLLEVTLSTTDWRSKQIFLTDKGKALMQAISAL